MEVRNIEERRKTSASEAVKVASRDPTSRAMAVVIGEGFNVQRPTCESKMQARPADQQRVSACEPPIQQVVVRRPSRFGLGWQVAGKYNT